MPTSSAGAAAAKPPHTGLLFGARVPMSAALGLIDELIGDDAARIRMPFNPLHTNG